MKNKTIHVKYYLINKVNFVKYLENLYVIKKFLNVFATQIISLIIQLIHVSCQKQKWKENYLIDTKV